MSQAVVYHDADADLAALAGQRIAVIGYGNQGRAQAMNLRDSGLDVIIGAIADASRRRAEGDGFRVEEIATAPQLADVVFLLIPDEIMPDVYERDIAPLRALRQHHPINEWEAQTRAAFGWKKVDAKKSE